MLTKLLNDAAIEELAGDRAFDRGADYFAGGHVTGLKENNGTISAVVRGTYDYRVKLWTEDAGLAFDCNCPVGQGGDFCKHCVAVGLAWLDVKQKRGASAGQNRGELTDEEIRAYLMAQDKGALVDLVLEHSE